RRKFGERWISQGTTPPLTIFTFARFEQPARGKRRIIWRRSIGSAKRRSRTLPTAQPSRYLRYTMRHLAVAVGPMILRRPAKRRPRLPAVRFATPATMPGRSVEPHISLHTSARILMPQQHLSIDHYTSIRASPTDGDGADG